MKLNDKKCKLPKPKDKQYKMFDGGGLYLLVRKTGSKLWQLKYRYLGKEKVLSIGQYGTVSLAEAREARSNAKKLLACAPLLIQWNIKKHKNVKPHAMQKTHSKQLHLNGTNKM